MLDRLFPTPLDNDYRGNKLALWLFYPLTAVILVRSGIHLLRADGGAQTIATIPLDQFSDGAAATIVGLFAQWGLVQLLLAGLFVVVLWRYRALLPFAYLLFLVENIGRALIGAVKPIETVGTPPGGPGSYIFMGIALIGLVLSLRRSATPGESAHAATLSAEI